MPHSPSDGSGQPSSYGSPQASHYAQSPQPWPSELPNQAGLPNPNPSLYGGYGQFAVASPLRGAAPAGAGLQIAANLIDGLITGVISLVVFGIAAGPAYVNLISFAASNPRMSNAVAMKLLMDVGVGASIASLILLALGIFLWWWLAKKGKNFGFAIFGLRLVSAQSGQGLGWGKTMLRYLVLNLGSSFTFGLLGLLFWLSPLFDNSSGWFRAWQDKMFDGVMINSKLGRDTLA